jgi:hypothetical protein
VAKQSLKSERLAARQVAGVSERGLRIAGALGFHARAPTPVVFKQRVRKILTLYGLRKTRVQKSEARNA